MKQIKSFFSTIWHTVKASSLTGRLLVIFIVFAALAVAMILSGPKPPDDFNPLATATPVLITPGVTGTVTPRIPSSEYKLTNGVVLGVVTVVLIILIGTVLKLRSYNKKPLS